MLAADAVESALICADPDGVRPIVETRSGDCRAPAGIGSVMVGNTTSMQVKAELEERDVGKVRVGQLAVIRSDAFPGKDFEGKVSSMAQALGPSRLGQRGPRKPTDVDVLEIVVELSGQTQLLPGMRVDVFLRPESAAAATQTQATKTN